MITSISIKRTQILFFCLILTNVVFSQNIDEKERRVKIADAQYLFLNEEYAKALTAYKELANIEPDNANFNYLTAFCYLKLPFENGQSIPYLLKAIKHLSATYKEGSSKETNAPVEALYWLGYAYHLNNGFSPAQVYYKRFRDTLSIDDLQNIKKVNRQIESCQNAKELSKHPVPVEIENLGNYVNSPKGDFNPCVNEKGNTLIYTRVKDKPKQDTTNLSIYSKKEFQIMQSFCDKKGKWSKAVDISDQLGFEGELKTLSLSSDGNELLLFKDDLNGGPLSFKSGSIYYSIRNGNSWSTVKILNSNINSVAWESHAAISPNGKEIYFTSDRAGGYGGLDIYVSTLVDGAWGPAKNLGSIINTAFDEETPEILPDGKTLYFSSEGHNNMGGFDIFYSSKVDSVNWGEPVNLGSPINSTDDNLFYVPIDDGSRAFYSVARNEGYFSFGDEDIYELDIELDSLHFPEIKLHGKISFRDKNEIDSTVTISCKTINNKKKKDIKTIKPDIHTGIYEITLKPEEYEISFSSKNYNTESKKLSFTKIRSTTPITLDATLDPITYDENKYITFNKVYFEFDNATLTNEAMNLLDKLYIVMDKNPGLMIEVIGHTDSRGVDKHSKGLAIQRSYSVVDYIVTKGIEPTRFTSKGEGNMIQSGENLNRCAEIKIIKSDNNSVVLTDVQAVKNLKKKNHYAIDLQESKEIVPMINFQTLQKDFPHILGMNYPNGYLYYFGNYSDQAEASLALNLAIAKGFKNAKIIDYFYINTLNNKDITSKTSTYKTFTIQLDASRKTINKDAKLKQNVREIKSHDGMYRYYDKEFTDLNDAEAALQQCIEQGFINAFILDVRDFK